MPGTSGSFNGAELRFSLVCASLLARRAQTGRQTEESLGSAVGIQLLHERTFAYDFGGLPLPIALKVTYWNQHVCLRALFVGSLLSGWTKHDGEEEQEEDEDEEGGV